MVTAYTHTHTPYGNPTKPLNMRSSALRASDLQSTYFRLFFTHTHMLPLELLLKDVLMEFFHVIIIHIMSLIHRQTLMSKRIVICEKGTLATLPIHWTVDKYPVVNFPSHYIAYTLISLWETQRLIGARAHTHSGRGTKRKRKSGTNEHKRPWINFRFTCRL